MARHSSNLRPSGQPDNDRSRDGNFPKHVLKLVENKIRASVSSTSSTTLRNYARPTTSTTTLSSTAPLFVKQFNALFRSVFVLFFD